jgi:hypothetical protein
MDDVDVMDRALVCFHRGRLRPVSKLWTAHLESETTNASNQQRIAKNYRDAQLMDKKIADLDRSMSDVTIN